MRECVSEGASEQVSERLSERVRVLACVHVCVCVRVCDQLTLTDFLMLILVLIGSYIPVAQGYLTLHDPSLPMHVYLL